MMTQVHCDAKTRMLKKLRDDCTEITLSVSLHLGIPAIVTLSLPIHEQNPKMSVFMAEYLI